LGRLVTFGGMVRCRSAERWDPICQKVPINLTDRKPVSVE